MYIFRLPYKIRFLVSGLFICSGIFAQNIYWLDAAFSSPVLGKAKPDGSSASTLALTSGSLPEAIIFDSESKQLFHTELKFSSSSIVVSDSLVSSSSLIGGGGSAVRGIAIDKTNDWIYYINSNLLAGAAISRIKPDGSENEVFYNIGGSSANPRALVIDEAAGKLYYSDFSQGSIFVKSINSADAPVALITGLSGPYGLALNSQNNKLYWSESNSGEICSSEKDGTGITVIHSELSFPKYITIDEENGIIYWTESGTPRIRKSSVSGGSITTLPIAVNNPTGIVFASSQDILPVELVSFNASLINESGNSVHLTWQTATEVNNYGFEIQLLMVTGQWENIGFVEGAGNSNSPISYSFIDNSPASGRDKSYRLKQIDLDGKYSYSEIIVVELPGNKSLPEDFSLSQNYPNPFNPSTTIEFALPYSSAESFVTLKIYNILGQQAATLVNQKMESGYYKIKFDASSAGGGLPSGVYLYRIIVSDSDGGSSLFTSVKKLLLIK